MLIAAYFESTRDLLQTAVRYRQLLKALAKRDISDEYLGQGLSVAWPFIHPIFLTCVYVYCFRYIFPTRLEGSPNFHTDAVVYLLAGLIPWLMLSGAMSRSLPIVVGNSNIVKQISFPLELLPIKALSTSLLFGATSLGFLTMYAAWHSHGQVLLTYLWGIPLLIAVTVPMLAGVALILSTLQVFYRDLKELQSMFLAVGVFIHPILYLPNAVPGVVRKVVYASPFSYLIFCWQDILFFGGIVRPWAWLIAIVLSFTLFCFGARLFVGAKPAFGDYL